MKERRANEAIREAARRAGVRHWRIADELGINEGMLCRMLRHELPENKKREILDIIQRLKGGASA